MRAKLCFDIAAVIIMTVVLVYHIRRNQAKNNRNSLFFALVLVSMVCGLSAIFEASLKLSGCDNQRLIALFESLYSFSLIAIPPCYVMYVILFTGNEQKFLEHIKSCVIVLIPEAAWLLYLLVFYAIRLLGNGFEISAKVEQVHNFAFFALSFFYSVIGLVYLYYFRKAVSSAASTVLAIPIVLTCISMTLRSFFLDYQSVLFVIAMCFLLLLLLNRQSMGLVDTNTGFRTQVALVEELTSAQHIKREMKLVLVKILNYRAAVSRNGYESTLETVIKVSKRITRTLSEHGIDGECFYDEDGNFVIIIPRKNFDAAEKFSEKLAEVALLDVTEGAVDFSISANVCLVSFPEDAEDVDTVLMLIDDLGRMKQSLHAFSASDITSTEEFQIRKQMNMIIDRALTNGYFSVYYQPIYCLKKDAFVSAEALIRLKDPEYGFISPGVFIPIAEKTGAIHKIGAFVFEEVCKFIASDEFKDLNIEYIEVNLSASQCLRINLVDEIEGISKKYDVSPKQLNLEITETAECYSQNRLLENVRTLHNDGYTFSLDDFGTGYSNLMRMAAIPLNIIKLDRAFVLMDEDDKFHAIIKNMVHLFKQMGLKILVEGIETEEMVEKFKDIDVDYIQGFYYSRPIPKDEYVDFVRSHLK